MGHIRCFHALKLLLTTLGRKRGYVLQEAGRGIDPELLKRFNEFFEQREAAPSPVEDAIFEDAHTEPTQ